jgi:transcriptional regulator with XRE-family HTH domain
MPDFGIRLKSLRKAKGLTLQKVADLANVSKSFVSQIENGTAAPSLATLERLCNVVDSSVAELLGDTAQDNARIVQLQPRPLASPPAVRAEKPFRDGANTGQVRVVRKDRRKKLQWPGASAASYLLTPDLQRKVEVILAEEDPGETIEHEAQSQEGEQFGFILEGAYEATIGNEVIILQKGDSIYYPGRLPCRLRVLDAGPASRIWVVTPPSF